MRADGCLPRRANPKKTKAIAEAKLKNDKVDARTLADLLRAKRIAHCYVPPESVRELRSLVRHRIAITRDMTRVKNRIHAILYTCKQLKVY